MAKGETIDNTKSNAHLYGTNYDDEVVNRGFNAYIGTGSGKDTIHNFEGNSRVYAGDDDDFIYNAGTGWYNDGFFSVLDGGKGNDTIENSANSVSIYGGEDNDLIILNSDTAGTVIIYNDGDGNDLVKRFTTNHILQIGDGSGTYSMVKNGEDLVITVGKGKITLVGAAGYMTSLDIRGVTEHIIELTERDDTYTNTESSTTVLAMGRNDSIYNEAKFVSINGGAGNDTLVNIAQSGTIEGGTGDDLIQLKYLSSDNVIIFSEGDGNDTIEGFGENDTLRIKGATPSQRIVGNDIVVKAGTGRITLVGAANLSYVNIVEEKDPLLIEGTGADDDISNTRNSATINAFGGNDFIVNEGSNVLISGGSDNDTIENNWGDNVSISGDAGKDSIYSDGDNVTISGGVDDDRIINNGGAKVLFKYAEGDGNDRIEGFNTTSTLRIGNGTGAYSSTKSGSDIIVTVGDGKITLSGAASLSSVHIDGTEIVPMPDTLQTLTDSSSSAMTIPSGHKNADASARSKPIKITGNSLNNSIVGGKAADTLNGGAGNDTLTGGWGADTFVYTGGKDVITDYGANFDKVSLTGDGAKWLSHITGVSVKDNNVTLTFSKDSNKTLTLNNAAGKKVIVNSATRIFGEHSISTGDKQYATLTSGFSGTFNANGYNSVNASAVTQAVTISGANSIVGGSKADSLVGTTGNDTLTGGYGADTFVYTGGKDVITDYTANFDKIVLNGTGAKWLSNITGVSVKNSNVTLTFSNDSNKKLTINGAAGKKVIVNNTTLIFENGRIYNSTKTRSTVASAAADAYWFDEHDFTQGAQLDSLMETSAADYSLGKLETTDNLTKLTQSEFLLTYGDDKK